ncbi:AbrB/MazE/SpoVT family DNA-binding domain-containing protein [Pseudomonas umsongensis]|nr:AbrB/MazE/SpoVT family DNA-binding domain-containing protein [Pseudomonas umsongensis]
MTEAKSWTALCQDPGDDSGDLIVDLPPDLIARLGLSVGDVFTMDVIHGAIVLTPEPKDSVPT